MDGSDIRSGNNIFMQPKSGPSSTPKIDQFDKQMQHINKKKEVNAEIKMSDRRLESYGIAPNAFKRKKIKAKYRQEANY